MKNLFAFILDFANFVMWSILLGVRLYQGSGWDFLTIVCAVCTLFNLIAGLVSFFRIRKARASEKQEGKSEKASAK